ncbi:MAG: hypothetical protein NZM42_04935 [Gemmatales bacterium]|nr:hypothetical protein [Gemmatales bacterium]MDW8222028.1 hypothetical protein [Gemmatales bacterium]
MLINLLALYNLYLIIIFAVGTGMRYRQYGQILTLILKFPQRWPKLGQLILEHRWILINWRMMIPTLLTLLFTLLHSLVVYWSLPNAVLTPRDLGGHLGWAALLLVLALPVLVLDGFSLYLSYGNWLPPGLDKQFDQAEYWLSAKWGLVIEWLTLKKVRPRQMVQEQLRSALHSIATTMNQAMWYWSAQLLARFLLALALWGAWFSLRA